MAWFNANSGGGKISFRWNAGFISKGLNLKNPKKIKIVSLSTTSDNDGIIIFGTSTPDSITNTQNDSNVRIASMTMKKGNILELEIDEKYPYITLWSVYNTNNWSAIIEITLG